MTLQDSIPGADAGPDLQFPTSREMAIERYLAIGERLPLAHFPTGSQSRAHLGELVDDIDAFVLDGFGVLNVGASAVPGALERVRELVAAGKRVVVLTNGATMPREISLAKYAGWGFEFDPDDIVSSRDALAQAMGRAADDRLWGLAASPRSGIDTLASRTVHLGDDDTAYAAADAFVLLSTADWNEARHRRLEHALAARPRPVLVGNPDLVAPQESILSIEPGFYAHALADAGLATPEFYGKPFDDVFALAAARLEGIPSSRIAMVGDTLHTDILGGAAFGWRSVLIRDHGLFRGIDPEPYIEACGIRPDYICGTT